MVCSLHNHHHDQGVWFHHWHHLHLFEVSFSSPRCIGFLPPRSLHLVLFHCHHSLSVRNPKLLSGITYSYHNFKIFEGFSFKAQQLKKRKLIMAVPPRKKNIQILQVYCLRFLSDPAKQEAPQEETAFIGLSICTHLSSKAYNSAPIRPIALKFWT